RRGDAGALGRDRGGSPRHRMSSPGDPVPDASVWKSTSEAVTLHELAAEGPLLLLFYLFDWSST
ncbi:MAG: hypothetical protein ACRDM9_13690, partial [Gaiellaceae bacterium]